MKPEREAEARAAIEDVRDGFWCGTTANPFIVTVGELRHLLAHPPSQSSPSQSDGEQRAQGAVPLDEAVLSWRGEVCKRCGRRNCVGFNVPDETWAKVVRGRFNVLCTSCFDALAEHAGIAYRFGEVWPVSWSDFKEEPRDGR